MRKLCLLLLILSIYIPVRAQVDSVFWFVAPEICSGGSPGVYDRPIKLNVASFNNSPVNITISQPANPLFTPINNIIPANGHLTVDLTSRINMVENQPADSILPYGLLIQATGLVSIYYEVNITGNNPEIYSLKGKNALGTDFIIPGQNEYMNGDIFQPTPLNRIDIVATENNTIVSIIPSKGIVGHSANVTFIKNLNKGETYSCIALGRQANQHLEGTIITSNHPISVTVTDDLLHYPGGGQDLVGDQIVPIGIIGQEYIAIKGTLLQNLDKLYILATENNTSIYINGNTVPATIINKGQTYILTFPTGSNAIYFTSSQPVYAFQLTGMGAEFGGGLLPSITCTGSKKIKYNRTTQKPLKFNICVPVSGINDFLFNGSASVITASDFSPVPGTGNQWYYATKDIPLSLVAQNAIATITNTVDFHLGVFEGDPSWGCSYAFFSDYAMQYNLQASTNHENKGHHFCEGDSLQLFVKDTTGLTDIQWTFPDNSTFFVSDTVIPNISLQDSGMYIVNANSVNGCIVKADTLYIHIRPCNTPSIVCTQIHYSTDDAHVHTVTANSPDPNTYLNASIWTWSGTPGIIRAYVKFDLSKIFSTTNTLINAANLYLFNPHTSGILSHSYQTTTLPVQVAFHRVTSNWNENTITWNNQPSFDNLTSSFSPLFCALSNPSFEDLELDISNIILSNKMLMSDYNGLMFMLVQENINNRYRRVIFEGRRYQDSTYWPRLEIEYEFLTIPVIKYDGCNTFEVDSISDIELIFDDIVHKWTINNNIYYGKTVQPVYADTFNVSLEMTLVNRLKDSCHYYIGDTICAALPIALQLGDTIRSCNDSVMLSSNYSNANYLWNTGETTENITVKTSGTYWVQVNNQNCSATDTVVVLFSPGFSIGLEDTLVLCNSPVLLDVKYPNANYLWSTRETTESITVSSPGIYWVEVKDLGCVLRDTVLVIQKSIPDFRIISSGDLCQNGVMQLSVALDEYHYLWNTNDTVPVISISAEGLYNITIGNEDCSASQSISITCPCDLWLPNIFTPNNDGINDDFFPIASSTLDSFSMYIYDRWGSLIYYTDSHIPWNGRYKGRHAASGVYYCIVYYSCASNSSKINTIQGSVTLIR